MFCPAPTTFSVQIKDNPVLQDNPLDFVPYTPCPYLSVLFLKMVPKTQAIRDADRRNIRRRRGKTRNTHAQTIAYFSCEFFQAVNRVSDM
jgi:hypothetical protein